MKYFLLHKTFLQQFIQKRTASGLSFRINELARFSDGSAIAQMNNTSVLVTSVSKTKTLNTNQSSFLPLTVDYREKAAAAGRIPTNHLRRELGLTDQEILTGRMIDRSIRPLFLNGYVYDTQVTCNILSVDGMTQPDILAINAASASLATSDIPWDGPIAAVRVGSINGKFVANPTREEMQKSDLNLVVSVNQKGHLVMIDASANRLPDDKFFSALEFSVECCLPIIDQIKQLSQKSKRTNIELQTFKPDLIDKLSTLAYGRLLTIFTDTSFDKTTRDNAITLVRQDVISNYTSANPDEYNSAYLAEAFSYVVKKIFRNLIFERSHRCDGRAFDQVRPINCQINLYEPLHGSALFQRGQTQVLGTVAFDALDSQYRHNEFAWRTGFKRKPFILHYEFPPYATNEIGRTYGRADRRELGHGALAEKGVEPVVPDELPFMIRLTAEVLESNGSSSMASVCAASLALMDAGIQIREPVAGVAIGLVSRCAADGTVTDHRVLTDILGIEDYMGDTDFKVAGTRNAITALQADIKNMQGLPLNIVREAIQAARKARNHIIDIMNKTISEPRKSKKNMPTIETLTIASHKRGRFLGVGGLNLKKILAQTGVTISPIDEITYSMFAPNSDAMSEAKQVVEKLLEETKEPELEFGGVYTAKIVEIRSNGVLIQLYPNMPAALLPNSQLDRRKIDHPSVLGLNVGDQIQVKYFGRDPVSGTMRLSRKILQSAGGLGPVKNMVATDKDERRPGIWDVRSSNSTKE